MESEKIAHFRQKAQAVDEFGEGVAFFLADTVCDDVSRAGKPARLGLARMLSQRLFGYTECFLDEVEEDDCHYRLLGLISSSRYGVIPPPSSILLVYRLDEPDVVALLFGSGKTVITGGKEPEDAEAATEVLISKLTDLNLLG